MQAESSGQNTLAVHCADTARLAAVYANNASAGGNNGLVSVGAAVANHDATGHRGPLAVSSNRRQNGAARLESRPHPSRQRRSFAGAAHDEADSHVPRESSFSLAVKRRSAWHGHAAPVPRALSYAVTPRVIILRCAPSVTLSPSVQTSSMSARTLPLSEFVSAPAESAEPSKKSSRHRPPSHPPQSSSPGADVAGAVPGASCRSLCGLPHAVMYSRARS